MVGTDIDVAVLVRRATEGDHQAWDCLVERYTPLVMAVVRRHRLAPDDAMDAYQTVWLSLVEHLGRLDEPRALPGWLMTTTRNECLRVIRAGRRTQPVEPEALDATSIDVRSRHGDDEDVASGLLRSERHEALLAALAELPDHQRQLLILLLADPPLSYEEISKRLNVSVGYIGPTRSRALQRLRQSPHLAALHDDPHQGGGFHGRAAVAG